MRTCVFAYMHLCVCVCVRTHTWMCVNMDTPQGGQKVTSCISLHLPTCLKHSVFAQARLAGLQASGDLVLLASFPSRRKYWYTHISIMHPQGLTFAQQILLPRIHCSVPNEYFPKIPVENLSYSIKV